MIRNMTAVFLLAVAALASGCATSRSEVKLAGPETAQVKYAFTKSTVVLIRSVTDERVYEEAPSDPSIPSLGHEGAARAAADVKARAFARKRGGFGKALGEVLLQDGQTVASVVRDNLVTAFRQAGYRATTNPAEAGASPLVVDAHIKQFWAWMQPGFFTITLNANIETALVTSRATPTVVSMHAENSMMAATDSSWAEIMDKALKDYRAQVAAKFADLP